MPKLSISTAWNETAELLRREGGLLYLIAFALISLPAAAYQFLNPQPLPPQGDGPGWMVLLVIPVLLANIIGSLTITILALGRENVVGRAIGLAARRTLPLLGAALIAGIGFAIVCIPFILIGVASWPGHKGLASLAILVVAAIALVFWAKLLVTTPVAAAEDAGPLTILKRSWKLTAGHFPRLLGFVALAIVLYMVVTLLVMSVGGLLVLALAGQPEPGSMSILLILLIGALVDTALFLCFAILVARIYVQLAGGSASGT
jgi:hypothetical protein